MKHNVWVLTLATALLASGIAFDTQAASDNPPARHAAPLERMRGTLERVREKLGVTDEQAAQIRSALASEKDALTETMTRLHQARTKLRTTIQEPGASEESVREAAAKVAGVESDAAVLRARLYRKICAVLTTEQVAKLKEMQKHAGSFVERFVDRVGARLGEE